MKTTSLSLLLVELILILRAAVSPAAEAPSGTVRFFPEHNIDAHLLYFFNQGDALQEERFVTEAALRMEFALVSWGNRMNFLFAVDMITDMGDSITDNLPFSPKDVAYDLSPVFEHRGDRWLARLGWNHVCQHLVYKDDPDPWYTSEGQAIPPDVYYNRLFLGIGTPETRRPALRQTFLSSPRRNPVPPIIWYGEAGYYLRSLGGLADEDTLHGSNDWAFDLRAELALPLWRGESHVLLLNSSTALLFDTDADAYLRQKLDLEAHFASSGYGTALILGANLVDEHPRDSKEGLWELGFRFYF